MSDMTRRKAAGGLARQLRPSRLLIGVSAAAGRRSRPRLERLGGLPAVAGAAQRAPHVHQATRRAASVRRGRRARVRAHARVRVDADPRRQALRVRALDQRHGRRGLRRGERPRLVEPVLQTPATAIPVALPWITGEPASLYWHVRAVSGKKVSAVERHPGVQHALVRRADLSSSTAARQPPARLCPLGRRSTAPRATRCGGSPRRQGDRHDHERRRRARVLRLPRRPGLDRRRRLARPRGPLRCTASAQERSAGRLVRPVEPDLPLGRSRPTRSRPARPSRRSRPVGRPLHA